MIRLLSLSVEQDTELEILSKSFIRMARFTTARKVSKYGDFSGSYFPVFSPNTGKYRPEKTPYLDTFNAVDITEMTVQEIVCCGFSFDATETKWI